jgi:hypothetical protein
MFDFIPVPSNVGSFSLNGTSLQQMPVEQSYQMAKFDFSMTFIYNPTCDDNELSCSLICSQDLFNTTTVELMSRRFEYFFDQIFRINPIVNLMNGSMISISKFSLIPPGETAEMEAVSFRRMENIGEEGM